MTNLSPRLVLLMTLPPLLWAGNAVVGRLMVGSVPPLALNALRWAVALVILLPLGWRVLARPGEIVHRWRYLAVLGLVGVGSYNALQYLALQTSTPLNVTLIAASSPVWMLAIGALAYGARPARPQLAGAAMSLLGVALVISRGSPDALLAIRFAGGDLFMLAAVVLWALYSWMLACPPAVMRDDLHPGWNRAEMLMAQMIFGVVWASAAAGVEAAATPHAITWSPQVIAAIAYVAIGPSLIAYGCWGIGVASAGPAVAAFFANLTPVFAGLLSAALLGELPRWYHLAAFLLIGAGIAVSSRAPRSTPASRATRAS